MASTATRIVYSTRCINLVMEIHDMLPAKRKSDELIDENSRGSFPASDAPGFASMTTGAPERPKEETTMALPKIKAAKRKPKKAKPAEKHSEVGISSRESFPASDPPSYSGGAIGAPTRNKSAKKKAPAKKAPGKKRPPIKEPAKKKKPVKRKAARPASKTKKKAKAKTKKKAKT